jgi:Na+/melibiose symporter-like transporter
MQTAHIARAAAEICGTIGHMVQAASATVEAGRGRRTALVYGVGSIAFGVKDQGFGTLLMLFYNQVLGVPASVVGTAIMIALIADAFIDPLVGYLSDHWRSRWGRRHPFMYAAVIPASLSYLALWNPPAGMSSGQLFGYLLGIAIVIRTFISCYEVPSAALGPELTHDYDERTSLLSVRFFFGWLGGLGMGIAAFKVFLVPDSAHPVGQLNPNGYSNYALTAAFIIAASMFFSALGTHRHIGHMAAPPPAQPFELARVLAEAKQTLANRAFASALGNNAWGSMAFGIVGGMIVYVSTYFWQLNSAQIALLMLGNVFSAAAALYVAPRLSRRLEKRQATILATLAGAVLGPLPVLLRISGNFPAPHSPQLLPLLFLFSMATTTCTIVASIISTSMLSDVVEQSELKTGQRSEGLVFSAAAFTFKCVSGVGVGAAGLILSLSNFPEGATPGQVDPAVLIRMIVLMTASAAVCNVLAIACANAYPITRAIHQGNVRTLDDARAAQQMLADADRTGVRSSMRPTQ